MYFNGIQLYDLLVEVWPLSLILQHSSFLISMTLVLNQGHDKKVVVA